MYITVYVYVNNFYFVNTVDNNNWFLDFSDISPQRLCNNVYFFTFVFFTA